MKKIININLSGRVIPIEDSAYESLQRYIESLRRYFAQEDGRDEIINDIESRIAELMDEKIRKGAPAVSDSDIQEIIHSMGRVEDFEAADADEKNATQSATGANYSSYTGPNFTRPKGRLYRDGSDKILGGVAAGIANYLNLDPTIIRLLFAVLVFGGGFGILLYILLWIFLPQRELQSYIGKRFFRNPDDKVIAGVAGGLAAYFNRPAWIIRLILAAPLILNVFFGTLHRIFFAYHRDLFPNFFIGSFTGTFCLAYIILWIVLPEARSQFEKMEMRGEKVDVNRIKQNVQEAKTDIKNRMEAWGEEVKATAQNLTGKASEFANTRGRSFAAEVAETARPVRRGLGHIIGIMFRAFFIFVAGTIALSLFAVLMVVIFGGVAWWPVNNYLWSSSWQKTLAWSTILFFFTVPVIAFITWLVRRILHIRSRNHYLSWTFGGLWLIGLISAIMFGASIGSDLRTYESISDNLSMTQPANGKLIVRVTEPEIHFNGNTWWFHSDGQWNVNEDSLQYNNVKIRVAKSEDSLFHTIVYKYSAGANYNDARARATRSKFNIYSQDSLLNLGSGLTLDRDNKFRGQGVIVEIQVPAGKMIRFDESIADAYDPWVVRTSERRTHNKWNRRFNTDWDWDQSFDWDVNIDYVMNKDGRLVNPKAKAEKNNEEDEDENNGVVNDENDNRDIQKDNNAHVKDSLKRLHLEQKRMADSLNRELKKTDLQIRTSQNQVKDAGRIPDYDMPYSVLSNLFQFG